LQSAFWGRFKARFGWKPHAFLVGWPSGAAVPLLVLTRPLVRGITFAYVPWGPELPPGFSAEDGGRTLALTELARALRQHLPRSTAFIRFDPPWYSADLPHASAFSPAPLVGRPFSRAAADIQPPDTVLIDLTQSEEELFSTMKEKCRYNVRLSAKKGVIVRQAGEEALDVFYRLFEETAERDGIAIHHRDYYAALFALAAERENAAPDGAGNSESGGVELRLYIAAHGGEDLAAIITLFRGEEAVYLYGASSNSKRNLMATYLLQWTAIKDAKAFGCKRYDLFGIPPGDDPSHPMAGLYRFKTGFGGSVIHRSGSWDFAYRPAIKTVFAMAEGLRKKCRTAKKHRK
jgi:lipid II:glycine glycyltransferase (peptidoglycan interpeptide bridge formation enzyme)